MVSKEPKILLPDGVTVEMVTAWKERYGENAIRMASLPKDDDATAFLNVICRVPDRKTVAEFEKWIDRSPDKAKDVLINACILTSKEEIKADDGLYFAAVDAVTKLLPVRSAIIKNL